MSYKDSTLWKEAFNDKYEHTVLRERLINVFEIAHSNASFLLDKIRIDFNISIKPSINEPVYTGNTCCKYFQRFSI